METKNTYQPWSEQSEQAVIGGIILTGGSSLPDVMDILTADHFHSKTHALIFNAMESARLAGFCP